MFVCVSVVPLNSSILSHIRFLIYVVAPFEGDSNFCINIIIIIIIVVFVRVCRLI